MTQLGRFSRTLLVLFVLALTSAGPLLAAEEVTVPFPRRGSVRVGLTNGPMVIRTVSLKSRPSARDVRKAQRNPDDTATLRFVFAVGNAGRRDWKADIKVQVLAADDRLLAQNDRADEVNARKLRDHISVWAKIRTSDYPSADRIRVEARFRPN